MMMRIVPLAAVLLFVAALANARILPSRSKQVKVYSYVLPAGAEEIRDDINHSFACANRTDGFYVDMDNDCQIFHRCQDNARFSFICAERTVFSQMYQTCVHDGQLGYPCEESAQYYPDGEDYQPSAPSSEAAEEEAPQVEEMNRKQPVQTAPVQELEAPKAPSHAAEIVAPSEEAAQDNTQQPSEQAESVQVLNDEAGQQQEQAEQHQMNADLFDPIEEEEEEGNVSSENSAQEVMDESEPHSTLTVPSEGTVAADPSSQEEESNEVEVMDDVIQQPQQEHEQVASSEPSSVVALSDTASLEEVTADEPLEKMETDTRGTPSEPAGSATPEMENGTQYEADSLLNAVQMVEELEPIVHDLAVETDELKPLVAEMVEDPTPSLFIPANQQDNEVLPESHSNTADMEAPQMTSDASSTVNDSEQSSTALESDQQVNELSPQTELSSAATAHDSSETHDTVSVEADETVLPASEPETVDVKLGEAEADTPTQEQERPLESPAIVEEMAPLRPNDSAELPELIVSTEFKLDAVTQGPPIRRRKTFLFRADAIRSRQ
ncbi:probable serine/threonine-protein kinase kinX [Anopheles moucheti]|uniref:probable serine/threonine-protein kinase kinX n=1 Tax=Anopheles moucheti TaxID=186751 RepID=UPI0022F00B90|nr:probable serine/threonine-protein kinase kinX [Anopheles moucheti]